tara:strand:- start:57 stop:221 length:165 start_codon:yes stop_codon:yes gene_type:complete
MLRARGISHEGWVTAMRNQALGTTAFLGSVESLDARRSASSSSSALTNLGELKP